MLELNNRQMIRLLLASSIATGSLNGVGGSSLPVGKKLRSIQPPINDRLLHPHDDTVSPTPAPTHEPVKGSIREFAEKFEALVQNGNQDWTNIKIISDEGSYYLKDMQEYGPIKPAPENMRFLKDYPKKISLVLSNGNKWNIPLAETIRTSDDWKKLRMEQRLGLKPIIRPIKNRVFGLRCRNEKSLLRYCTASDLGRLANNEDSNNGQKARIFFFPKQNDVDSENNKLTNEDQQFVINQEWEKSTYEVSGAHWFGFILLGIILGCCTYHKLKDILDNNYLSTDIIQELFSEPDRLRLMALNNGNNDDLNDNSLVTVYTKKNDNDEQFYRHLFHLGCIREWITIQKQNNQRVTCPINKQLIVKLKLGNHTDSSEDTCPICLESVAENDSNVDIEMGDNNDEEGTEVDSDSNVDIEMGDDNDGDDIEVDDINNVGIEMEDFDNEDNQRVEAPEETSTSLVRWILSLI